MRKRALLILATGCIASCDAGVAEDAPAPSGTAGTTRSMAVEIGEPSTSEVFHEAFRATLVDKPNLLARAAITSTQAFEIYATGPVLLYTDVGLYQEGTVKTVMNDPDRDLPPVELYRKLAPGKQVPARLQAHIRDLERGVVPKYPLPEVAPVARANTYEWGGGIHRTQTPGRCPAEWFAVQSAAHGEFCNTSNSRHWCFFNRPWGFFDILNFKKATGEMLLKDTNSTVCVDEGMSPYFVTISGDARGGDLHTEEFDIPAGQWRQVFFQTSACIGPVCSVLGVKYDIHPGGNFHWGGYWWPRGVF
jgi:hypothetical protein